MDDEGEITVGSVASIAYPAQEGSCHSLQQQLQNTSHARTSFVYILALRAAFHALCNKCKVHSIDARTDPCATSIPRLLPLSISRFIDSLAMTLEDAISLHDLVSQTWKETYAVLARMRGIHLEGLHNLIGEAFSNVPSPRTLATAVPRLALTSRRDFAQDWLGFGLETVPRVRQWHATGQG